MAETRVTADGLTSLWFLHEKRPHAAAASPSRFHRRCGRHLTLRPQQHRRREGRTPSCGARAKVGPQMLPTDFRDGPVISTLQRFLNGCNHFHSEFAVTSAATLATSLPENCFARSLLRLVRLQGAQSQAYPVDTPRFADAASGPISTRKRRMSFSIGCYTYLRPAVTLEPCRETKKPGPLGPGRGVERFARRGGFAGRRASGRTR